jgi:adenylate cyclase
VLAVAIVLIAAVMGLRVFDPWFVAALRDRTFDFYQRYAPRPYDASRVRVVVIDDVSLATYGQWPWPRTRLAAMTQRLFELGASVIAFDAIFPEPDSTSPGRHFIGLESGNAPEIEKLQVPGNQRDHDEVLAEVIKKAPVVLSFAATTPANNIRPPVKSGWAFMGTDPRMILTPFVGAVTNIPILDSASSGVGSFSATAGEDGVVRRIPMLASDGSKIYPSLVVEALRIALGGSTIIVRSVGKRPPELDQLRIGEVQIPLTGNGELWLRYDRDRPERYLSAKELLQPAEEAELRRRIEGHIVFIGVSAVGLGGSNITALGETVPGVSIHAQAVEQILDHSFLSRPHWTDGLEVWATMLLSATVTVLLLGLSPQFTFIVGGLAAALAVGASWATF